MPEIVRLSLQAKVYDVLRADIVSGTVSGGTRLLQGELAARFGVSRIPVRDAIRQLVSDGLVEMDGKGACHVIEVTADDIREIYRIRGRLEGLAIRLAAAELDPASLAELEGMVGGMRSAGRRRRFGGYVDINRDFHMRIYRAAKAPRLLRMIENLWLGMAPLTPLGVRGQLDRSLKDHTVIFAALAARDPDAAEAALQAHIKAAGDSLLRDMAARICAAENNCPAVVYKRR